MKTHRRLRARVLFVAGAIVLIAVHGIVFRLVASHTGTRAAVLVGAVALVLVVHVGLRRRQ